MSWYNPEKTKEEIKAIELQMEERIERRFKAKQERILARKKAGIIPAKQVKRRWKSNPNLYATGRNTYMENNNSGTWENIEEGG